MNRIRFAMAPAPDAPKLQNTVELDEVYVGPRKPRYKGVSGPGRSTLKTPVFCAVERGGQLRRRVVADVTATTLRQAILEDVDSRARLMTDEFSSEYARADVHVNTAESSHALIRRGLIGISSRPSMAARRPALPKHIGHGQDVCIRRRVAYVD